MEQTPPPPCCCLKKLQLLMNIGSGRAGSMFLCSLSSTASRAVSCSLFQGWGLRHTFQVAYVCSFLFQAVFWLISSRDQAVVPAPKLPISTQGVILSLHTCYCLRGLCYVITRSQLTFLHIPFAPVCFCEWIHTCTFLNSSSTKSDSEKCACRLKAKRRLHWLVFHSCVEVGRVFAWR